MKRGDKIEVVTDIITAPSMLKVIAGTGKPVIRAKKGEKGVILSQEPTDGYVSIRITGRYYPLHNVNIICIRVAP